jgi:hypothetical protein
MMLLPEKYFSRTSWGREQPLLVLQFAKANNGLLTLAFSNGFVAHFEECIEFSLHRFQYAGTDLIACSVHFFSFQKN